MLTSLLLSTASPLSSPSPYRRWTPSRTHALTSSQNVAQMLIAQIEIRCGVAQDRGRSAVSAKFDLGHTGDTALALAAQNTFIASHDQLVSHRECIQLNSGVNTRSHDHDRQRI